MFTDAADEPEDTAEILQAAIDAYKVVTSKKAAANGSKATFKEDLSRWLAGEVVDFHQGLLAQLERDKSKLYTLYVRVGAFKEKQAELLDISIEYDEEDEVAEDGVDMKISAEVSSSVIIRL